MTYFIVPAGAGEDAAFDDVRLHLAAAAYLARFKGLSREHTDSDLRAFLSWCAGRGIDPLRAQRAQLELYVRWMQETRRFKPSTVSETHLSAQRVLPHRRYRRRPCTLTGRVRPPTHRPNRVTHTRSDAPSV